MNNVTLITASVKIYQTHGSIVQRWLMDLIVNAYLMMEFAKLLVLHQHVYWMVQIAYHRLMRNVLISTLVK